MKIKSSKALPQSIPKLIGLGVFGAALGLLLSNSLLKFAVTPGLGTFFWLLLWITLLPLAIGLFAVLVPKRLTGAALTAVMVAALLSFFVTETSLKIILVMFLLMLLNFMLTNRSGKKVYDNMIRFNWLHMGPYVVKPALTSMAFFVTVFYFVSVPVQDPAFSKSVFTVAIKPAEIYLNMTSSGTTWNSTVRDRLLNAMVAKGAVFQTNAEKEQTVNSTVAGLNTMLSSSFGKEIVLKSDEVLNDVAFRLTDTTVRNMDRRTLDLIISVLGIALFLTLFYIFRILSIFSVLFAHILFKILKLARFYSVTTENKEKEILRL